MDYCKHIVYNINAPGPRHIHVPVCMYPVLRELHWLPVRQRVDFKVACLAYQSLSGQAPQYLAADIQLISDSGRCHLRSASDRRSFHARRIPSVTEVFASPDHACGRFPPGCLRREDISYRQFRQQLKSCLFV